MALGALALPDGNVGFDAQGTAMVPVTAGKETVGTIELKSPFEMFKETFSSMKESLLNMVGLQTKEQEAAAFVGPMPNNDLEGVDTDDNKYGNFVEKAQSKGSEILDGIKEAFDNVSFGEKMMAVVLAGGFFIFTKYKAVLTKVLTPIVQFVMDTVKFLGPTGAFAAFLGGFILLKSGLAKKGLMKAGSLILSTIKKSAASLDRQGGLFKAMGNGFERINKGAKGLVGSLSKAGSTITGGLTKGFNLLGKGLTSLRLGIMSMSSSLGAMIVPFLPVIAIAAAAVAIFFSLKSGFETFKESLDNGDSMFTAVIKGLGDAMLTLVTLPATLVKKLVGFIAGLFGFDNFKSELESFSIKDAIVNTFKKLTDGMVNIIKAIAKGAAAALAAAIPGGKTPQEEFARVYGEVMRGGEGESAAIQGTSDFQGDQSTKDFNKDSNEKVKGYNNMGEYLDIDEGVGTGNSTAMSYYNRDKESLDGPGRFVKTPQIKETEYDDFSKLMKINGTQEFEQKILQKTIIKKQGQVVSETGKITVIKGGNVQGDTINQKSETNITGDLDVNNTEFTQKMLNDAF